MTNLSSQQHHHHQDHPHQTDYLPIFPNGSSLDVLDIGSDGNNSSNNNNNIMLAALNYTNETIVKNLSKQAYTPYDERPETYVIPVLFFLIFVVGVLGNGTLVIIFLRHRTMRNVPNTYILSLALADLLVIVTSVPFTSIIYTLESWPWGELICKLSETAKDISIGVSVFTLTALSADRFFAIVDPLKKFHTTSGSKKCTRITLCIAISIWLLAILCAVPAALGSHLMDIKDKEGNVQFVVCYPFPTDWLNNKYPQVMIMSRFLVLYVIPLTIIGIFYLNMANHLIVSTRNVPGEMQGTQRQIRARKKVAITVLIFVLVFAVCFLPSHMFMLFFYFHPRAQELYNAFWHYLRIVGFCLGYLNSCANPVALYWVSGAFRKHFNRYLLCMKPKRSRCNTCQGHQNATTMSMVSTRRHNQSVTSRKGRSLSINRNGNNRLLDSCGVGGGGVIGGINDGPLLDTNNEILAGQETSVTLLGNGNDHVILSSKM